MFTILYPEIAEEALKYPGGIHAFRLPEESIPFFFVKMMPQYLLTAKINKGFKIYVVPLEVSGIVTVGLMAAFFDDSDNPLTVWRPLADEPATRQLVAALSAKNLKVHLFDEHNRELLGYAASVGMPLEAQIRLECANFHALSHPVAHALGDAAKAWFSTRTEKDDTEAISIAFDEPLFPEDIVITDMNSDRYDFHGSKGFNQTSLIKTEPGYTQEIDIILLLQRIFHPSQIFHAPKRINDGEEISDVMVITDKLCLIVQAKDSPNTDLMLQNSLERKRKKALKQLKEGITQASGAIGYLRRVRPLKFLIDGEQIEIDLANRNILSLVVVRELFDDGFTEYSELLFDFLNKIDLPCIALDYSELHNYTSYCDDADEFIFAFFEVFNYALANGQFPRLRFGMNDLFCEDGAIKFNKPR